MIKDGFSVDTSSYPSDKLANKVASLILFLIILAVVSLGLIVAYKLEPTVMKTTVASELGELPPVEFDIPYAVRTAGYYFGVPEDLISELIFYRNPGMDMTNLMQLSPNYLDYFVTNFSVTLINLEDPRANIQIGVGYLAALYNKYHDWHAAALAWLAGPVAYESGTCKIKDVQFVNNLPDYGVF